MVLNFAVVLLAVCGLLFAYFAITRTQEFNQLQDEYARSNQFLGHVQTIASETAAYEQKYPDPKLKSILQLVQPKANAGK